jgi:hypothetical protein
MTIGELKSVLSQTLEECENFDDNCEIRLQSNTYFVNDARYFIGFSGYHGGYLDLDRLSDMVEPLDDYEDEDDDNYDEDCEDDE